MVNPWPATALAANAGWPQATRIFQYCPIGKKGYFAYIEGSPFYRYWCTVLPILFFCLPILVHRFTDIAQIVFFFKSIPIHINPISIHIDSIPTHINSISIHINSISIHINSISVHINSIYTHMVLHLEHVQTMCSKLLSLLTTLQA
jgi:hypothetical protein